MSDKGTANGGICYCDEVRRKLVHLSSLWTAAVLFLFPKIFSLILFGGLFIGSILVEHAYANGNIRIIRFYDIFFGGMLRKKPHPGQWVISGGPPVFASAFLSALLFTHGIASCSMAIMLIGDTAAALTGRKFGTHKLVNGKSAEGFLAFFLAAFPVSCGILLLAGYSSAMLLWAVAAVFFADCTELFEKQLHVDDNLAVPLTAGLILTIAPAPNPGQLFP